VGRTSNKQASGHCEHLTCPHRLGKVERLIRRWVDACAISEIGDEDTAE
jgi:hypothetical protein